MTIKYSFPDCMCGKNQFATLFHYVERPSRETDFGINPGIYDRTIQRCKSCGHCVSVLGQAMRGQFDLSYQQGYVDATYQSDDKMRATYERIMSLPPEQSDNVGRVKAFVNYAKRRMPPESFPDKPTVLDVGSGLCVFLKALKDLRFKGAAIDPDPRAVSHARDLVGVEATQGDFLTMVMDRKVDVVSLNKVLEHVEDPIAMLAKAATLLHPWGWAYVEVPDADGAARAGADSEEFFIEHFHIFSAESATLMAERVGLHVDELQCLLEPSGKYTIRLFLTLCPAMTRT